MKIFVQTLAIFLVSFIANVAFAHLNPTEIERLTKLKGQMNAGHTVFKVKYPRTDLHVMAQGIRITPAMGLTAWAAFTSVGSHVEVMGDLVLTENQINSVMSAALDNGLKVTALHNHYIFETPKIMYMHIEGMGPEPEVAQNVGKVFAALKATAALPPPKNLQIDQAKNQIDTKAIDKIFGTPGHLVNGVYKIVIGRTTFMHGHKFGKFMGVNTWAAFIGSNENALVEGDFAMRENEVQNVLKTLRKYDINIAAIHQHMLGEKPRILFLHYWGVGRALDLAKALKAALRTQNK